MIGKLNYPIRHTGAEAHIIKHLQMLHILTQPHSTCMGTNRNAKFSRQQVNHNHFIDSPHPATVNLAVKQGLSAGLVEWGIIGPPNHKTYFFRGPAIQGCALAEQTASSSDIVLDGSVQSLLAPDDVLAQPQPGGFAHLLAIAVKVPRPKRKSGITFPIRVALAEHFFPLSLGAMGQHGEFRNVATVFLSFAGDPPLAQLDDFISRVMGMMRQFGGHFAEVDFGDKGGLALVYFGAPTTHENDIARALDFVLALQIELAEVGLLWRAGISFGPVYTGLIGTVVRGKYSTLGNQVNLASGLAGAMGKLATMGLAAAVFSPWMNISGSLLANYWRRRGGGPERDAAGSKPE